MAEDWGNSALEGEVSLGMRPPIFVDVGLPWWLCIPVEPPRS